MDNLISATFIVSISDIKWDAPKSVNKTLPTALKLAICLKDFEKSELDEYYDIYLENEISDFLSDTFGFCHDGYVLDSTFSDKSGKFTQNTVLE